MNFPVPRSFNNFRLALLPVLLFCISAIQAHATPVFEPLYGFVRGPEYPCGELIEGSDGNFYGTTSEGGRSGYGTVFKMTPTGTLTTLVNFTGANGGYPGAGLVQGSDGDFYGTTSKGGSNGSGTVFKMTSTGALTILVNFTGANGSFPYAALVQGSDGNFYGTTSEGGTSNDGTVFRMTPNSALTTLVSFSGANGDHPRAGLVQGSDGNFYGTTSGGGNSDRGTAFKMTAAGVVTTLVNFTGSNGSSPQAGLVQGTDGSFYGTTSGGGSNFDGTVFRMTASGALTNLANFSGSNGLSPRAKLTQGIDGNFYGTTSGGGLVNPDQRAFRDGTVFKITPSGTLTTLVVFIGLQSNESGGTGMALGSDGNFYGMTKDGGSGDFGRVFKLTSSGTFTSLVDFTGTQGSSPLGSLVQGDDGNFYGTTSDGGSSGSSGSSSGGHGTSFKMTPSGSLTTLEIFTKIFDSQFSSGGCVPTAGLVKGSDGNFYGTTRDGGTVKKQLGGGSYSINPDGFGTVFKMTPSGQFTTLVYFNVTNGSHPRAGLLLGSDGNFYGTTSGAFTFDSSELGTVFRMTPAGALTTLVNFTGAANGSFPYAALVQGSDGNFYGTTSAGGSSDNGTVFMMTPSGTLTTLVNFTGSNGSSPEAGLVKGSDGNFYGTTSEGGTGNFGTVFKMTPEGTLATLANFAGNDGSRPVTDLLQGSDGNFYGTTSKGGSSDYGTVFRMTPSGTLTTLVTFNGTNGRYPKAGLIRGNDHHLYGTTSEGGSTSDGQLAGGGQIYRLRLGPTVVTQLQTQTTSTSATLNGTVNPGGYATSALLLYSTDPTLSAFDIAGLSTLPAGITNMPVQANISGLLPGTTYYYRILANNTENTFLQYGAILSFTTPGAQGTYSSWALTKFTTTQLADLLISGPTADPDKDGIVNFLESAFNLLPLSAGNQVLTPATGTVGLPRVSTLGSGPTMRLRLEYIRRKSGYTYFPEVSSGLSSIDWTAPTGTPTVTSIDTVWERVVIEDEAGTGQPKRFGRVMVTSTGN